MLRYLLSTVFLALTIGVTKAYDSISIQKEGEIKTLKLQRKKNWIRLDAENSLMNKKFLAIHYNSKIFANIYAGEKGSLNKVCSGESTICLLNLSEYKDRI